MFYPIFYQVKPWVFSLILITSYELTIMFYEIQLIVINVEIIHLLLLSVDYNF